MLHVTRGDVAHAPVAERGDEVQFDPSQSDANTPPANANPSRRPISERRGGSHPHPTLRAYALKSGRFNEQGRSLLTGLVFGGAKGIRTPDPLHAMEMRYQLRHSPVFSSCRSRRALDTLQHGCHFGKHGVSRGLPK